MSNFAKICLKIDVKLKDCELVKEKVKPIDDFCDKHDIGLYAFYDKLGNYILAEIETEGLTTRYCRGCVYEVKQMFKNTFKSRIELISEIY